MEHGSKHFDHCVETEAHAHAATRISVPIANRSLPRQLPATLFARDLVVNESGTALIEYSLVLSLYSIAVFLGLAAFTQSALTQYTLLTTNISQMYAEKMPIVAAPDSTGS